MQEKSLKVTALDHHGIIAAVCKDLGIAKRIDDRLNKKILDVFCQRWDSGVAMVINGLGFYQSSFVFDAAIFESKPIDRLLGSDIS